MLDEAGEVDAPSVSRVLLCSGKIYYDLLAARQERKVEHIAIVRVEQLYPFMHSQLEDILRRTDLVRLVGRRVKLNRRDVDWEQIREWLERSWRACAPPRLTKLMRVAEEF